MCVQHKGYCVLATSLSSEATLDKLVDETLVWQTQSQVFYAFDGLDLANAKERAEVDRLTKSLFPL